MKDHGLRKSVTVPMREVCNAVSDEGLQGKSRSDWSKEQEEKAELTCGIQFISFISSTLNTHPFTFTRLFLFLTSILRSNSLRVGYYSIK